MTTTIADRFAEANTEWKEANTPYPTSLWVDKGNGWVLIDEYNDPYEAMTPLVLSSDNPTVLMMFGNMVRLDDDGTPTDEKTRVRLLFAVHGDEHEILVQPEGGEAFYDSDAEGMFMEVYNLTKTLVSG